MDPPEASSSSEMYHIVLETSDGSSAVTTDAVQIEQGITIISDQDQQQDQLKEQQVTYLQGRRRTDREAIDKPLSSYYPILLGGYTRFL